MHNGTGVRLLLVGIVGFVVFVLLAQHVDVFIDASRVFALMVR